MLLTACNKQYPKQYRDYTLHSGIGSIVINEQVINDLEIAGKVWGYVKYHHPLLAKNMYNIDYELFELIPLILQSNSARERNNILADWIDRFGPYKTVRDKDKTNLSDSLSTTNLSLTWMFDTLSLGGRLSGKLLSLRYADRRKESQYVSFLPHGVPVFEQDDLYAKKALLDCGQRLLALFRYWNTIEYYFPYKYMTDNDWSGMLKKYLPAFINADVYSDYFSACYRLFAEINDTHAFSDAYFRYKYGRKVVPIQMRFMGGHLMVTDVLQSTKDDLGTTQLCAGDEILQIGGELLGIRMEHIRQHTSKSNETVFLRDAVGVLGRTTWASIKVAYKRGSNIYSTKVPTVDDVSYYNWVHSTDRPAYEFLADSVGHIRIGKIGRSNVQELSAWISECKALVIDMRGYPLDSEFYNLVMGKFVPNNTAFCIVTCPVKKMPGLFELKKERTIRYRGAKYSGRMVVIVDETTQSHAEFLTMLLQTNPNVTVIGSQTAGADGNITEVRLPGAIKTTFSSVGIYYPDGRGTQRTGVFIDKVVIPTIQGLVNGKDELVEHALSIIKNEETPTSY